jgi:uncharacterized membrane protein
MVTSIIRVALLISAVATGLFAGLLWTFAIGVDPMYATLDGPTYARIQQTMIGTIDAGIPPVLILTAVAPLVALVALGVSGRVRTRVFAATLAAFLLWMIFVMAFTVILNVPINNDVLSWDPAAPPAHWAQARDEWDRLNNIRTPIAILSFVLFIVAYALPLPARVEATQPAAMRA